ncbi:methyltransferase family protein [Edaphobacter albus]|uniref:methyltransferase family protein n=1 Tax=Edaphobacter sp. 4G125 TaxID=2763071 RepID=UPI00164973E0|nr:isoprenylcysteine carboxylmethyltransferase family protein [Edaphobacter sp. 4G125]QNI37877.1 isoprenylcysteine carboxylmethyltransferase family protein [Edaphobacter sp. 4G125]
MLGLFVAGGVALWFAPFLIAKQGSSNLASVDRQARWGILLEFVGIGLVAAGGYWSEPRPSWRIGIAIAFFLLAALLSWTATRTLGKQFRLDAAIGVEHELIRNGPYRIVRHPIYTSMLCVLWAIGFITAPTLLLVIATMIFLAGTEIRVRIEDRLLEERFGDSFRQYKLSTPAYLPFLR